MNLILLGYWRSEDHPEWPDPSDFVDPDWDEDERSQTSRCLFSGTTSKAFMGWSSCRICGAQNGNLEYTDGVYAWPQGLAHYVDDHAVRLPPSFVAHAIRRLAEIETAGSDDSWWRGLRSAD